MYQTFFTETIQNKFIKELLHKTPVPLVDTCVDGDYIVGGFSYIYKHNLIRCKSSGIVGSGAQYDVIRNYTFGEWNKLYTEKYISKYTYYDTETHKHLGDLLRLARDELDINLMPYYNCFGYKVAHNIGLSVRKYVYDQGSYVYVVDVSRSDSDRHKVLATPVKFGKTYTVSIDSDTGFCYSFAFLSELGGLTLLTEEDYANFNYDRDTKLGGVIRNSRFNEPVTISVDINTLSVLSGKSEQELYSCQKNLYLIIQVPSTNTSSILVQEGDYTTTPIPSYMYSNIEKSYLGTNTFIDLQDIDSYSQAELDKMLQTTPSLRQMNTGTTYAFSDRLIEYLLLNVIDLNETIGDNIESVQKKLLSSNKYPKGVWFTKLRIFAYKYYMEHIGLGKNRSSLPYDISGYIDKDMEEVMRASVGDM